MKCEDMSDFELDLKLAKMQGLSISPITNPNNGVIVYPHDNVANANYCTDWNATMPIADEHSISSIRSHGEWEAYGWVYGSKLAEPRVSVRSNNRLRAIVICLIKVLEAKRVQNNS